MTSEREEIDAIKKRIKAEQTPPPTMQSEGQSKPPEKVESAIERKTRLEIQARSELQQEAEKAFLPVVQKMRFLPTLIKFKNSNHIARYASKDTLEIMPATTSGYRMRIKAYQNVSGEVVFSLKSEIGTENRGKEKDWQGHVQIWTDWKDDCYEEDITQERLLYLVNSRLNVSREAVEKNDRDGKRILTGIKIAGSALALLFLAKACGVLDNNSKRYSQVDNIQKIELVADR